MSEFRQLAAIMFTDIVGYTALMGEDELRAFELLNKNRQIQRPLIEQFGGKWIKELGDGVMASFQTVSEAVFCAGSIQQACDDVPGLQLRIGIHLGEVVFTKNDVFGDGVNIASRLQAMAPPGKVWVSESVYKNVFNKKGIITDFIGEQVLKNVKEPVKVYEVRIEKKLDHKKAPRVNKTVKKLFSQRNIILYGTIIFLLATVISFYVFYKSADPVAIGQNPVEKSIAVLYFQNMSGDPAQDYFSDGITEEIITRLSYLKDLRVISRTSVLQYKGKGKNIKDIARELNCNSILEGSVRKSGNQVRITAQLIDATTDKHLWSDIFDKELKDIFEIQTSVAQAIADKFALLVSPSAKVQISHQLTRNMEAYDLYLKAKAVAFKDAGLGIGNSSFNRDRAMVFLRKAVQLDPAFSEALALLSRIFLEESYVAPESKYLVDSAIRFAQKSIDYNPNIVDGYIALAYISESGNERETLSYLTAAYKIDQSVGLLELGKYYINHGDFVEAMKIFDHKVRLEPNKVEGYIWKSSIYNFLGQQDSALKYLKKSKLFDPYHKSLLELEIFYYIFKGNIEETIKSAKQFYQDDSLGYLKQVGIAYLFKKDWKKAEEYYKKTNYRDLDWALILWKTGRKDSALKYAEAAIDFRLKLGHPFSWDLSRLYVFKNDLKNVIYYLKKGLEEGTHYYDWIKNDPFWDEVRHTPEFKKEEKEFDKNVAHIIYQIQENQKKGALPSLLTKGLL